jgi:hypothetical protein
MIPVDEVPTEQTTAATDVALALLALVGLVGLWRLRSREPSKVWIWVAALGCLAIASALGAVAHGVRTTQGVKHGLWLGIYLSLGLLVAWFVIGTVHDLWGARAARRIAPVTAMTGVAFVALAQLIDGAFVVFVIYEAVALSFALIGYAYLTRRPRLPGAGLMAAGILVTLGAAAIQATRLGSPITVVWTFDHNGLFHIVQMPGVVLILLGLRTALLHRAAIG